MGIQLELLGIQLENWDSGGPVERICWRQIVANRIINNYILREILGESGTTRDNSDFKVF